MDWRTSTEASAEVLDQPDASLARAWLLPRVVCEGAATAGLQKVMLGCRLLVMRYPEYGRELAAPDRALLSSLFSGSVCFSVHACIPVSSSRCLDRHNGRAAALAS